MSSTLDIIYFGGAFDPIHFGHMDAVKIARQAFPLAKITLLPGFILPKAGGEIKSPVTPFVDRVAMAVVAFDEWPMVDVSSIEEELPTPNYTFATLEALLVDHPSSKLGWMIGADQLATLPEWKNPRRILELASLVVLPRPAMSPGSTLELAKRVVTALGFGVTVDADGLRLDLDGGESVYVMEHAPKSLSSTEVRRLASEGLKKLEGFVAAPVIDYIADLGLYQKFEDSPKT